MIHHIKRQVNSLLNLCNKHIRVGNIKQYQKVNYKEKEKIKIREDMVNKEQENSQ